MRLDLLPSPGGLGQKAKKGRDVRVKVFYQGAVLL